MIVNPEWTVFIIFSTTVLIFSYILRVFELPYYRLDVDSDNYKVMDRYFNSIYVCIITMTTVGYGDISPSTTPGKVVTIILALTGTFMISIVVVTVSSIFDLSDNQKMALRHIRITRRAAVIISSSIKYFLAKKRYYMLKDSLDPRCANKSMFMSML